MKKITLQLFLLLFYCQGYAQSQLTNTGNLYLHADASVTFFGDFNNSGTFTDSGQVVNFTGSTAQAISGTVPATFNHLVIANASGVSLLQSADVSNSLMLTTGPLWINSNTLTITKNTATAITRTSGYIVSEQNNNSGKLSWNIGSNTDAHEFPFGTVSGTYIPFVLSLTSGTIGKVTVSTYPTAANNTPYPSSPIAVTNVNNIYGADNSANTVDRFWQVDKDGVSGTATLTFTATSAETGAISGLQAQRWNAASSGWDQPLAGQTSTTVSATVPGVTSFSPWTLSGNGAPLPIELLSFTATAIDNDHVELHWTTATETNNDFFTVEKATDGIHFETVAIINGAGNSTQVLQYSEQDLHPYNGISYYRLKQTDFNGAFSYAPLQAVEIHAETAFSVAIFPNPSNGPVNISITGAEAEPLTLIITDALGRITYSETVMPSSSGEYVFTFILGQGSYMITLIGNNTRCNKKLIIG